VSRLSIEQVSKPNGATKEGEEVGRNVLGTYHLHSRNNAKEKTKTEKGILSCSFFTRTKGEQTWW
jgi:hypothetical protein